MWKKNELPSRTPEPAPMSPGQHTHTQPEPPRHDIAVIGPSITIKGEVSGHENLEIQGKLEGTVSMKEHRVTVGQKGCVKADIHAKAIHIAGEVEGNLFGDDEVVLRESGRLLGNITAARVTLEDGSKFKGSIDMGSTSGNGKPSRKFTPTVSADNGTPPADGVKETAVPVVRN
jgi:cytoskeletal protein CcmA (bactofilin family)